MTRFKALTFALSGVILSAAAMAADSPAPAPQAAKAQAARPFGPGMGPAGRGAGCFMGATLSPEARLIHMQDVTKQADTLTVTKFREARKAECDKFAAMSADAKAKYAADLEAKWKALPDSEKLKLYHDALDRRAQMGRGMGRGMGMGPGMGMVPGHHKTGHGYKARPAN